MLKKSAHNAGDLGSVPGLGRWLPTPIFLPGEFYRQRSLVGYSPWSCKELATLSDYHSQGVKQYHIMHRSNIPKRTEIDHRITNNPAIYLGHRLWRLADLVQILHSLGNLK